MKPRITLDMDHTNEHEHDQTHLKKTPPLKTKAMNQKSQRVSAKSHRKSIPR